MLGRDRGYTVRQHRADSGRVARKEQHLGMHLARYEDADSVPLAEGLKPRSQVDLQKSRGKEAGSGLNQSKRIRGINYILEL